MKTSTLSLLSAALATGLASAAAPSVTVTSLTQAADRTITVAYTLADGPAVITLDIETNSSSWASIGGKDLCRAQGDVWKLVNTAAGTITWRPSGDEILPIFPAGEVRAVVTAWPTNDPPTYMVVDLTENAAERLRYYQNADFVPGGVLSNTDYRISKMLMRKIPAAGVTWTMGSVTEGGYADETPHNVTLADNYYLACFALTEAQGQLVTGLAANKLSNFTIEGAMRPCTTMSYINARENTYNVNTDTGVTYKYPNPPHPWSFLGRLRARTGNLVDFDLPSEAQWEFAARAGNGCGYWNNGLPILNTTPDANLNLLGRYESNGGMLQGNNPPDASAGPTNATAIVGSYAPSSWGLYDMHGNVLEWCLDWYADDITGIDGKVNINPANPANTLSSNSSGGNRVRKGGVFYGGAGSNRPAYRAGGAPTGRDSGTGIRVICTAGLK